MLCTGLAVVLATASLVVPGPAGAVADPVSPRAAGLAVTGFAYGGLPRSALRRDAHALTTVTVDGVALLADGSGVVAPGADALRLGRDARAEGLRTELLVHNFSDGLGDFDPRRAHLLLSNPEAIDAVSTRLADLAVSGGWGGVNVDLELVRAGDAAGLVALCEAVRAALPEGRTVTIDISASGSLRGYRERGYDLAGLAAVVDRIELMAYDQHGPSWSGPGPVGGLAWQRRAVLTMRRIVPADRIDLGVAGYGYAWRRGGGGWTVTPAAARRRSHRAGVRPVWHARAGEWSALLPGGTVLWWSDARSYRQRVRLARSLGVHGLALWRLGSADPLP
ncbi:glycosyl hydrolase family 18 protein [Nocardioides sp.]|uniref:glycosyl hydrolase family 18 protein n=1 Tax=Nocardioides sp. TaxID=35761 RepID=UPI00271F2C1A|nr:glycosyl hydrolase family 18 protein [Nocardioides sp.]MDO9456512.1 glycosyl hydrolase family 18 protein [Nocardioides sp.]